MQQIRGRYIRDIPVCRNHKGAEPLFSILKGLSITSEAIRKFKKLFKQLDKPTFSLVENLISELAFMSVTLEENRQHIEEYGVKELYMNGKGQFGYKESVESKNYNAMIKNYTNVVKQIVDFFPKTEKKNAGEELLRFIASGNK